MHSAHEFDVSLNRSNASNSCLTAFSDTQPRNHCNDSRAFLRRFFDNNHNGVSGTYNICDRFSLVLCELCIRSMFILTKQTAITVTIGTNAQYNATDRQAIRLPSRNTMNIPNVFDRFESPINIPRIDG